VTSRRTKTKLTDDLIALADSSYFVTPGGLGTNFDKARVSGYCSPAPDYAYLTALYEGNGTFARAVGKVVEDALRNGFEVRFDSDTDAEDATEYQSGLREWIDEMNLPEVWERHLVQMQLFGGSVLLQVTDQDQTVPKSGPVGVPPRYLAFAPQEVSAGDLERDPFAPNYALPTYWQISDSRASVQIDPSWARPLIGKSLLTSPAFRNRAHQWTGPSFAQRFLAECERYGIVLQSAASASQMLYQVVYKIGNMLGVVGNATGKAALQTRLNAIESRRSMLQPIALDATEDLSVLQTSLANMPEVIDRCMVALAAAAGQPVTVLFGVSPGGFGTGESELRSWQDTVRHFQRTTVRPMLRWCLTEYFAAAGVQDQKWSIVFNPLTSPTAAEQATLENQTAQTDAIYLANGVLTPDEVAMSRFGGGEWSAHTSLDMEAREALENEMELELANEVPTQEDPQEADREPSAEPSGEDDGDGGRDSAEN
jgi:phage-related protein (TIGR01555 family)